MSRLVIENIESITVPSAGERIAYIKAIREDAPQLSLKEAKDIVYFILNRITIETSQTCNLEHTHYATTSVLELTGGTDSVRNPLYDTYADPRF